MNIFAFLLAIVSIVLFVVEWSRTKGLIPLGLAFAVTAVCVQLIVRGSETVSLDL